MSDHDPHCPMQQCEHGRVWCEHECHCDTIAAVHAELLARLDALTLTLCALEGCPCTCGHLTTIRDWLDTPTT